MVLWNVKINFTFLTKYEIRKSGLVSAGSDCRNSTTLRTGEGKNSDNPGENYKIRNINETVDEIN